MKSEQINTELEKLREQVKPTLRRISELEQSLRIATSTEAIKALGLRPEPKRRGVQQRVGQSLVWRHNSFRTMGDG